MKFFYLAIGLPVAALAIIPTMVANQKTPSATSTSLSLRPFRHGPNHTPGDVSMTDEIDQKRLSSSIVATSTSDTTSALSVTIATDGDALVASAIKPTMVSDESASARTPESSSLRLRHGPVNVPWSSDPTASSTLASIFDVATLTARDIKPTMVADKSNPAATTSDRLPHGGPHIKSPPTDLEETPVSSAPLINDFGEAIETSLPTAPESKIAARATSLSEDWKHRMDEDHRRLSQHATATRNGYGAAQPVGGHCTHERKSEAEATGVRARGQEIGVQPMREAPDHCQRVVGQPCVTGGENVIEKRKNFQPPVGTMNTTSYEAPMEDEVEKSAAVNLVRKVALRRAVCIAFFAAMMAFVLA